MATRCAQQDYKKHRRDCSLWNRRIYHHDGCFPYLAAWLDFLIYPQYNRLGAYPYAGRCLPRIPWNFSVLPSLP